MRNVGNFFIGMGLRVCAAYRTRIPLSRLPMGFLRPLKEMGADVRALCLKRLLSNNERIDNDLDLQ